MRSKPRKRYPNRFAVMGRIPMEKPESAALLPKWKEQPGMIGVRLTFQRDQAALLTRARRLVLAGGREGRHAGDVLRARTTSRSLRPIAERHPGLPLIIDHMSLTQEIAQGAPHRAAIDEVVKLAKYPNVSVKLSSAPNFSQEAYPWRDMTEHLKRCFDAYRAAPLLLGHRPHQLARQGDLPAAHRRISPRSCRSSPSRTRTG